MDNWRSRIIGHDVKPASDFLANEKNFRIHPAFQQEYLRGSLDELGWVKSVIVNKRSAPEWGASRYVDTLIDGHDRIRAALRQGDETLVPVEYVDLSPSEEETALMILDEMVTYATLDKEKLAQLAAQVKPSNNSVQQMCAKMVEQYGLAQPRVPTEIAEDEVPVDRAEALRQQWDTNLGQLWELGRHRLVIGDCRDARIVNLLMRGDLAEAVITDPPYGIKREGILNDDPAGLKALYEDMIAVTPMQSGIVAAFQSPRLFWVWLDVFRLAGHKVERMLWMYKPNDETFPWRGWLLTSEAILITSKGKGQWLDVHPYAHDVYSSTTLGSELTSGQGWHASVKPMAVIRDLVSRIGGLVYDPFVGSGTTLLACEQLTRICRAVELSPASAAVTLQRWADFTGLEPRLVESSSHAITP